MAVGKAKGSHCLFHDLFQYYSKLEEKHQAMEEQKIQLEARLKVIHLVTSIFHEDSSFSLPFLVFR